MTTTKTEALDLLRLMQSLYEADLMETAPEWALSLRNTIADMESTHPAPTQPDAQGLPTDRIMLNALRSLLRHAERVNEVLTSECGVQFVDDGPLSMARDAIALAQSTQQAQTATVPEGFVLVPVEPTEAMLIAGALAHQQSPAHDFEGPMHDAWASMLQAAKGEK